MKYLVISMCLCFVIVGCIKGKKIVYTNPEKGITVELSEEQVSVTGTHTLEDGSILTVTEEAE